MVRVKGLEPPHLSIPEPKSGASTSSATAAARAHCHNPCDKSRRSFYKAQRDPIICPTTKPAIGHLYPVDPAAKLGFNKTPKPEICFTNTETSKSRENQKHTRKLHPPHVGVAFGCPQNGAAAVGFHTGGCRFLMILGFWVVHDFRF